MKRYLLCLLVALMGSACVWASTASPEPFEFVKPDGTKVMARIYGDEFHSYIESLDGELLQGSRDPEVLEEADMKRRIHRATQAAGNSNYPTTGSPRALVLLVSYTDQTFSNSLQDFRNLLNQSGYSYNGAIGSCRDYFIACSDSIFQPQFDCYGPYTLAHNTEYYGANEGSRTDKRAYEMILEACQLAHNAGVNFKNYDTNNDGVLDNVFVYYAGHGEANGAPASTIWAHQSDVSPYGLRLDGVLVSSYACSSELYGASGSTRCGIGTFCHEFSHVLGQPDFYDTGYNYYTVGNWDLMSAGNHNNRGNTPPLYSAYERMYVGWLTPKQLLLPGQYVLTNELFKKEAYLIAASTHNLSGKNPNPSEFFLLDYRSADNIWDMYLPGNGMIVWHIDYLPSAWVSNTPNSGPTIMRMHMEEANGIGWKRRARGEDGRASDVYPGTQHVTSFDPVLHDGTNIGQPIFNIEENGGVINFTYISDGGSLFKVDRKSIELTTTVDDNKKIVEWEPQSFNLIGMGLDPEKDITLTTNSNLFSLYAGDEAPKRGTSNWKRTLTLNAQNDSTLEQRLWVCFNPSKQSCDATKANISINSTNANLTVSLVGNAPRPTYVTIPTTYACDEVTPYSFTAHWKNVNDAEYYYLTLYESEEGTTEFKQGFENFSDQSSIREQGWQSNTTLTTTSAKADGSRALYIKNHGDQVTSETYPSPVTKISFWYNAFSASVDTIGVLEIEAYNGKEWLLAGQEVMKNKSKRVTATYDFEESDNYRVFRVTWIDNGGSGIAFDAFVATASQKITYMHKGKDITLASFVFGDTASHTFGNLLPDHTYYYQVQTTDADKGCEEHLTELSDPIAVRTISGKPADDKHLTLAIDSINYDPARHTVYLTNPQSGDYLYFYNGSGRLVQSIPVKLNVYGYPLDKSLYLHGEMYMIQHAASGKLGRKNKWVKFIF